MKKLMLIFAFSLMIALYLPAQAKDMSKNAVVNSTVSTKLSKDVRYVRVRGKRYKVWYTTYYKKGKRYYRITRIRRA